jgi:adenosylhomocysteine nucleosidase
MRKEATDLAFDDPCILFALRREANPFLREFRPQLRFPGSPCWARFCGPAWLTVLVLETGVGAGPTEKALEWVLSRPVLGNVPYQPKVILSAGFAGALHPDRKVGDVVLATNVTDSQAKHWQTTWPSEMPPGPWQPPLHQGRVISTAQMILDPAEKRALGQRHEAMAVDMESATVARLCTRHGVPFGCVRVVSDDSQTQLSPQVASLFSGGRLSGLRILKTVLRSPQTLGEFGRLARQTRLAADQLGKALGELLTLTLPWGADL